MNIQLSISLLASNRATTLERCLDSLRPLLMQVPSELIVVFTGTDEKVKEIAARYTDNIIPFTWCGNFSAARNVGLWAARGEWFLYIDDDEWFEDVTEIRDFFLSGEYKKYGSALYKQKNYEDWDGVRHSDFHAFRMTKIVPGTAFQNTVHEELIPKPEPWKYFETYVNHYGYVSDSGKLSSDKSVRNIPLLIQGIKDRPSYIKNYLQLVKEYSIIENYDEAEEYIRKGLKLCQGYKDNYYRCWFQTNLLSILYEKKDYEKVEQEALYILKKDHPWEIARLDIYATLLAIYSSRNAYDEILRYGLLFEETLVYMDENPELWMMQSYDGLTEQSIKVPSKLYNIRVNCTRAALNKKDNRLAAYFLKLLPWKDEDWMQRYYPSFDNWKKEYSKQFQKLLSEFPGKSPYFLLQEALCCKGKACTKEEQQILLIQCIKETKSLYLQCQVIKEAIQFELSLAEIVIYLDLETWKQCAENIIEIFSSEDEKKLLNSAKQLCQKLPVYGAWISKILYEKKLVHSYLTGDLLFHTLDSYAKSLLQFYQRQYQDEMFKIENQNLLPGDCRFALYVSEALKKMKNLEYPESVHLLHKAIRIYPKMTGVIREVIRQMTVKVENPVQNGAEFRILSCQMKEALNGMLNNGQYIEALPIILQLSSLLPEDLEVLRIRQKILCELAE